MRLAKTYERPRTRWRKLPILRRYEGDCKIREFSRNTPTERGVNSEQLRPDFSESPFAVFFVHDFAVATEILDAA